IGAGAGTLWILIRMIMGLNAPGRLHDDEGDGGEGATGFGLWGASGGGHCGRRPRVRAMFSSQ
ncbi:MAG: hypothetical protein MI723_04385, partial [Caulobacterales bacterium]|nr:hypothetical protein [Caulobacterales bacterium]